VEVHPDGGVVAIPANTNAWPYYYRDKAIELIESESPGGYDIVREEEAVARKVTHVKTHTDVNPAPALVLGGPQDPPDGLPGPGSPLPGAPPNVALPLGLTHERSTQVVEERDVTEWRIHYRRR
jgi:hypothetical protein